MSTAPSVFAAAEPGGVPGPILEWLLEGDPSIRWQTLRDLVDAPQPQVVAERSLVEHEGWGARLLGLQTPDGSWGGGLYRPKWTSTTFTLLLLHWLGLPAGNIQALHGCARLWDGAAYFDGGLAFGRDPAGPEACVTGMLVLASAAHGYLEGHDRRLEEAVRWLLANMLDDGGWNCAAPATGSTHSSFHTTITTLDALSAYRSAGGSQAVDDAVERGQQFFLRHWLFLSHRTGELVNPAFGHYPFPPQLHFDIVRGLDHFRSWGADRDPRLGRAIDVLRKNQKADGVWYAYHTYPGHYWFLMEQRGPSRWSTLRCGRILKWWNAE